MPCGPLRIVDGGKFIDPRLVNPESTGGLFTVPLIDTPSVRGPVTLDDAAAESLADRLETLLDIPLDEDAVAKVFKDSTNGLPLVPGTQIVTKDDTAAFRAEAEARLAALDADLFASSLSDLNGLPLTAGTKVATKPQIDAFVAEAEARLALYSADLFASSLHDITNDLPLTAGTRVATKADVDAVVEEGRARLAALNADLFASALSDSTNDLPLTSGTQVVTKDDAAALVASIRAEVSALTPNDFAAALHDSTNDLPLTEGTQVVTKADSAAFRAEAEARLAAFNADLFASSLTDSTNGDPLVAGTPVVTKAELAGEVSKIYKAADGTGLAPGTTLLSADEVAAFVSKTICEGCGEAGVSELLWDPGTRTLTVKSIDMQGDERQDSVILSGLSFEPPVGSSPALALGNELPSQVTGSRDFLLGKPDAWLKFKVGAQDGVVPWFQI